MNNNSTNPIFNDNKLKLGTFCTNTIPNMSFVPEILMPTWQNTLACAKLADEAGLEALVPIARWKGYLDNKPDHPSNIILETFTWAAAVAASTKYSAVFSTSHAPTMHPVLVAKESATIDAISGGRFALNIVGGWNRREFDMFGIDLLEHDQRYVYLEEWLDLLRRLWTSHDEFDYQSKNFRIEESDLAPAADPTRRRAGDERRSFAGRHAFLGEVFRHRPDQPARSDAGGLAARSRELQENGARGIRPRNSALDELRGHPARHAKRSGRLSPPLLRGISGHGSDGQPDAHDQQGEQYSRGFAARWRSCGAAWRWAPDIRWSARRKRIAEELAAISRIGIDGVILTWVDYVDGVDRFNRGVLPLLEQAGLRKPFIKKSA